MTWRDEALCARPEHAHVDWFPVPNKGPGGGENDPEYRRAVALAKSVCVRCCVRDECLEVALAGREVGVWGGLTEDERARVGSTSRRRRKALTDRVRRERLRAG